MMTAVQHRHETSEGLSGSRRQQLGFLLRHADPGVLQATWQAYQPSFTLALDGLVFAASLGLALWLVFLGLWMASSALVARSPNRSRSRPLYK